MGRSLLPVPPKTIMHLNVPTELSTEYRRIAIENNVTLSSVVVAALRSYLAERSEPVGI